MADDGGDPYVDDAASRWADAGAALDGAAPDGALRAIVVDDDALARSRIAGVLASRPHVRVVAECADGAEAVAAIRREAPDVVFLDVQMPGMDGFQVVSAVGAAHMPPVVFTSAYAEFAVRAFEAYALDYVLKPFDDERLLAALDRVRPASRPASRRAPADAGPAAAPAADPGPPAADPRLAGLLEHLARVGAVRYPDAMAVRSGKHYVVVRVADVAWIEADGNYARLHTVRGPRLLGKSLAMLERDVLDPRRFVRVHRSAIVNLEQIASVEPLAHGDLALVLECGARVDCSRRHRKALEGALYFTT